MLFHLKILALPYTCAEFVKENIKRASLLGEVDSLEGSFEPSKYIKLQCARN